MYTVQIEDRRGWWVRGVAKLLFLFCAQKFGSEYLWVRHVDDAVDGHDDLSEAQLIALESTRWELDLDIWSNKQRASLSFVDPIIYSPVVEDEVFEAVREYFDAREIMEIISMQGVNYTLARVQTVLRVGIDKLAPSPFAAVRKFVNEE